MNTLIYGPQRSGKTLLANALVNEYQLQQHVIAEMYDESQFITGSLKPPRETKTVLRRLRYSKGKPRTHTIVVSEYPPHSFKEYDTTGLFDFAYRATHLGG